MKKIVLSLMIVGMFAVVKASADPILYNATATTFNVAVSTFANPNGTLISSTTVRARISRITISYELNATTNSVHLYENLRGSSPKRIYSVLIPSSTTSSVNYIVQTYDYALPKIANYGLMAICDDATRKMAVVVEYW